MNKLCFISLIVVAQTTALTAGSITLSNGNVRTQGNQVVTGSGARAEATVDQRGSVVRLGSNTAAQVGDRGEVSLSKGVVLVSSGDGFLRRPAVQVSTPQGDVTVRGSAIVAALPDGSVKMTCLEGHVRGDLGGQGMALNPGNLIVQRQEGTRDAVQVNLNALTSSSALLDTGSFTQPLPAATEIRQEVVQQAQSIGATLQISGENRSAAQVENKTVEVKQAEPGLLARIFGAGDKTASAGDSSVTTGPSLQIQSGGNPPTANATVAATTQAGATLLRVSGQVSGSNILLNSAVASVGPSAGTVLQVAGNQQQNVLAATPNATISLSNATERFVVANGSTQIANQGVLTVVNAGVAGSSALVKAGAGTLVLNNNVQTSTGVTVNSGTLVLQGAAAQQFAGGTLTVTGPGGTTLVPTSSGGAITFQPAGGTPPANPAGGIP